MPGQCPAANRATRSTCPRGRSSPVSVCGVRARGRSVGLRAPRAGDTEPGTAGPGARAARGLAQGQRRRPRAWLGGREGLRKVSLQPGESGRCAVRCARGSGACGAGSGAGEGARRLEEVCVRAEPGWTLAPPSGVCGGGGAGGGVWRGGGRGSGGGGGSRKVGKSWRARGSALTARAEGSGVRSGLGETQGEGWPPAPSPPSRGTRPGRAPATPVLGFRCRLSLPSSCYLQKNPAARLFAGLLQISA